MAAPQLEKLPSPRKKKGSFCEVLRRNYHIVSSLIPGVPAVRSFPDRPTKSPYVTRLIHLRLWNRGIVVMIRKRSPTSMRIMATGRLTFSTSTAM